MSENCHAISSNKIYIFEKMLNWDEILTCKACTTYVSILNPSLNENFIFYTIHICLYGVTLSNDKPIENKVLKAIMINNTQLIFCLPLQQYWYKNLEPNAFVKLFEIFLLKKFKVGKIVFKHRTKQKLLKRKNK